MYKEVFLALILALFYPDSSWLSELTNLDHLVEYNTINLSQVGADPDVVINNTNWPLTPTQRTDSGLEMVLATYDTKPTHVTNVEELETSYNKLESVLRQHAETLRVKVTVSAAYNISPTSNTANTPVLKTTGVARPDGNLAITFADIIRLRTAFNKQNIPMDGRVLVLSTTHEEDLLVEDLNLYRAAMTTGTLYNFRVYISNVNPTYSAAGVKNSVGAIGQTSSFAFYKPEVMRCMGDIEGEPEKRWADYRGWLLGMQLRFSAMAIRNKGIAAIYSDVAQIN